MRVVALVLFVGVAFSAARGVAVAAPVPKHLMKEGETEKAKLQGKWKVETMRIGDKDAGTTIPGFDMTIEFSGDTLVATSNTGGVSQKTTATVKHDATAGVKRFTTVETKTAPLDGKGQAKTEKDELFSYTFDGDKLLLGAAGGGSKKAPDPLKPGSNDIVLVLVRMK